MQIQRGSTFHKVVFTACVTFCMVVIMYELVLIRQRIPTQIHIAGK